MSKTLKPHKRKRPVQLADLYNTDFKRKYFDLLEKTSSLQREKVRWQLAFQETEDLYNHSPCGFHSLDANAAFLRVNDTELKWLGYSREELIGKKITELLVKQDVLRFRECFSELKKTGFMNEEFTFIRKDNSLMTMLVNSIGMFDKKGRFQTSRAILLDTSTKKLNEQILASQKELKIENIELQQANEEMSLLNDAKDRFIGIAYHDLQNPLAVIMLMSKILLGDELPGEKHRDKYQAIYEASLQMHELIKNYLNVNRMETGSLTLNVEDVDIVRVTESIISRYQEVSERKSIPIFFTSRKKTIISTDPECYSQVVENILSNAIKYTPHGKSIFVKVDCKGMDVSVIIEDEGVGVKKEEIPRLFGKFQQLSSRPTGGELSTGLGLSIVKFLMDELNGTIKVKSKLGKGTKFILCFRKDGKPCQPPLAASSNI